MNVSIWSWGDRARGAACNERDGDMTSGDTGPGARTVDCFLVKYENQIILITSEAGWQLF